MANSKRSLIFTIITITSLPFSFSSLCPIQSPPKPSFIHSLQFKFQCHLHFSPNYPLQLWLYKVLLTHLFSGTVNTADFFNRRRDPIKFQFGISSLLNELLLVDGFYLDRALTDMRGKMYTSVLFYASWCPFSHDTLLTFEALGSMFPQIQHLAIEQTAAMPSTFSRYGVHSLPSILLVKETSRMRFRDPKVPKDIHSLVRFYQKITGFEPVHYVNADQYAGLASREKLPKPLWIGSSLHELIKREPYLLFSALFIIVKMFLVVLPIIVSRLRAFWELYAPQLNLEIFGEASQMLGRARNMINVKMIWAKNAREWASSLASVSLGGASTSRLAS